MQTFYKKVDRRSKRAMVEYLENHFRYNTANSWNGSTSYANCLKIHHLELDSDVVDSLFDLIELPEFYDRLSVLIQDFNAQNNYRWQAGWNGRSGGYLVLYNGEMKPSGYKSHCIVCGQLNCTTIQETGETCGRCRHPHGRINFEAPHMQVVTFPGRAIDQYEDFDDWSMDDLRDRVELIQDFDKLADEIVQESIYLAKNYKVVARSVLVEKETKVMVEATA